MVGDTRYENKKFTGSSKGPAEPKENVSFYKRQHEGHTAEPSTEGKIYQKSPGIGNQDEKCRKEKQTEGGGVGVENVESN